MLRRSLVLLGVCVLSSLVVASASLAADGATIFKDSCERCHGADARGDTKAGKKVKVVDLTDPKFASLPFAELLQKARDNKKHKRLLEKVTAADFEAGVKRAQEIATNAKP
jgi:cytochrome c553